MIQPGGGNDGRIFAAPLSVVIHKRLDDTLYEHGGIICSCLFKQICEMGGDPHEDNIGLTYIRY